MSGLPKSFVARWSFPIHDRLTRNRSEVSEFDTEQEAIAAIIAPFPNGCSDAHVVELLSVGRSRMIALRKCGKKIQMKG